MWRHLPRAPPTMLRCEASKEWVEWHLHVRDRILRLDHPARHVLLQGPEQPREPARNLVELCGRKHSMINWCQRRSGLHVSGRGTNMHTDCNCASCTRSGATVVHVASTSSGALHDEPTVTLTTNKTPATLTIEFCLRSGETVQREVLHQVVVVLEHAHRALQHAVQAFTTCRRTARRWMQIDSVTVDGNGMTPAGFTATECEHPISRSGTGGIIRTPTWGAMCWQAWA